MCDHCLRTLHINVLNTFKLSVLVATFISRTIFIDSRIPTSYSTSYKWNFHQYLLWRTRDDREVEYVHLLTTFVT